MTHRLSNIWLTVHRSTQEIGGNCIEIATHNGHRIVLDVGRPLDALADAGGLLPPTLKLTTPCDGVLLSHAIKTIMGYLKKFRRGGPSSVVKQRRN
jgi:ribonuclease J